MGDPFRDRPFPRAPLLGAAALIALTVASAGAARIIGVPGSAPTAEPVAMRELRFMDRADGGVDVLAADDGHAIEVVAPGTNGFLRSTMRGLARERKRQEIGADQPFRLTAWADGRLTLEDRATARLVDLGAFGPTNAEVFARLLASAAATR